MTNSRDFLSQEEIDALLNITDDDFAREMDQPEEETLTLLEKDALGEIGNITFGSAATALSSLLGKKVDITTPEVSIITRNELVEQFPQPHVAVHVDYVDGFDGINLLVIKKKDASIIADLMMGGTGIVAEDVELTDIHISAVQEAMNQMMGSSATAMSTIFNRFVNISPPGIDIMNLSAGEYGKLPNEAVFVKISFRLIIGDLIDSSIMQLLPVHFAKEMIASLMGGASTEPPAVTETAATIATLENSNPTITKESPMKDSTKQPESNVETANYGQHHQPEAPPRPAPTSGMMNRVGQVQSAQFGDLQPTNVPYSNDYNLDMLLDIPLNVTVELGRTKKQIKEILELSQGSIIELDKLAGEPVDILVNNKLIARGEVVVIDENFGVRVTDIISQWERMKKIQ